MKKTKFILSMVIAASLVFTQCKLNKDADTDPKPEPGTMEALNIPDDFNFETTKTVDIDLEASSETKFTIYTWDESFKTTETINLGDYIPGNTETQEVELNNYTKNKVFNTVISTNKTASIEIPSYIDNLYVVSDNNGKIASSLETVSSSKKSSLSVTSPTIDANDVFHLGGGGSGPTFHTYDSSTGTTSEYYTGSGWFYTAMTTDSENGLMFHHYNNPLIIVKHNVGSNTEEEINVGISDNIQDLAFNPIDKKLYAFSTTGGYKIYRINTEDGSIERTWTLTNTIYNLKMEFDGSGKLYMLGDGENNTMNLLRTVENINTNTDATITVQGDLTVTSDASWLMFRGISFGSDEKLYAYSDTEGGIGTINLTTGVFSKEIDFENSFYAFGIMHTDNAKFVHSDNDGVSDYYDEYPNDGTKAYNSYYPSETEWVTVITEDLWPSKGDYDYNDMVVGIRYHQIKNADNNIIEGRTKYKLLKKGGSYKNGFGLRATQITPSDVESYTGAKIFENYLSFDGNGLEAGQTQPFMFAFDNMTRLQENEEFEVVYKLNTPFPFIGFRPFAIINGERGRELWRPWGRPSPLADQSIFGTFDDDTNPAEGKYYKSKDNAPWMILISRYEYKIPLEAVSILKAYPRFANWAESGGTEDRDWYLHPDAAFVQ